MAEGVDGEELEPDLQILMNPLCDAGWTKMTRVASDAYEDIFFKDLPMMALGIVARHFKVSTVDAARLYKIRIAPGNMYPHGDIFARKKSAL